MPDSSASAFSRSARGARSLPAESYRSADVYALEQDRIFASHWICVGRSEQLEAVGAFAVCEVGGESLLLVRGEDRQLRALFNVCRHRGAQLCDSPQGQFAHRIRCPYHSWTYGLDGRLLTAPNLVTGNGPPSDADRLQTAAAAEWNGFLCVNLSAAPTPLGEEWAALEQLVSPWQLDRLRVAHRDSYQVSANWKLLFENFNECYHCPSIHPLLSCLTPYRSASNDLQQGPILGGPMELGENAESLTQDGRLCAAPLTGLSERDRRRVYFYSVFPSMFVSLHPEYVLVHRLEPQGAEVTQVVCEYLFDGDSVARGEVDASRAIACWDVTNREDWQMCERVQRGARSRAFQPGLLCDLESVVAAWDRHYLAQMQR